MKKLIQNKIFIFICAFIIIVLIVLFIYLIIPKNNSIKDNSTDNVTSNPESTGDETESNQNENPSHADMLDEESIVEDEGDRVFYIEKEEVKKFSLTDSNGILLEFERDGEQWVCVGYEDLDLDEERVDKILNYICDIRFVDSYNSEDGSEYGLTADSNMFMVEDSGGNDVYVCLGDVNAEDGSVYFALNYDYTLVFKNSGKLANVCDYAIEEILQL